MGLCLDGAFDVKLDLFRLLKNENVSTRLYDAPRIINLFRNKEAIKRFYCIIVSVGGQYCHKSCDFDEKNWRNSYASFRWRIFQAENQYGDVCASFDRRGENETRLRISEIRFKRANENISDKMVVNAITGKFNLRTIRSARKK